MKKNKLSNYQIFSAIFAIILGTLLHFTYEWFNKNTLIAAFSSINESTWEHLKLAFIPMLITTIIGFFKFKNIPNFLCSKMLGIITTLGFITSFFRAGAFHGTAISVVLFLCLLFHWLCSIFGAEGKDWRQRASCRRNRRFSSKNWV